MLDANAPTIANPSEENVYQEPPSPGALDGVADKNSSDGEPEDVNSGDGDAIDENSSGFIS